MQGVMCPSAGGETDRQNVCVLEIQSCCMDKMIRSHEEKEGMDFKKHKEMKEQRGEKGRW